MVVSLWGHFDEIRAKTIVISFVAQRVTVRRKFVVLDVVCPSGTTFLLVFFFLSFFRFVRCIILRSLLSRSFPELSGSRPRHIPSDMQSLVREF